jgi:hypothetical protein
MTPQVSKGLRRLLPWVFVLGLQVWLLIAFGAFESVIAIQEWRYRRGTKKLERAIEQHHQHLLEAA